MNKVMNGYFDDAHRSLQRQQTGSTLSQKPSQVQLPPLGPSSGGDGGDDDEFGPDPFSSTGGLGGKMRESKSMGSLGYSHEEKSLGVQQDQFHAALQDSTKMARKVRALQDQLAITSAKKEAFKAQAQRLEREFKKGRDQTDTLQRDLLQAKQESGTLNKDAQEAISMMSEMRKSHIAEVKLLQRGLNSRNGDKDSKNRVNEMADLVDKVGRAVVQRDEAIRDKTKMQAQLNKAMGDLRAASDDVARYKKQSLQLGKNLKEAKRKGQYAPPRPRDQPEDDSDDDFEQELFALEKRFEILEEGPAGLDILASNLSKEKQELEKKSRAQQQTIKSLQDTIENWKLLGAEKDNQIKDLNAKLEKVMREQAIMEEQIAQKQRDIALQVAEEKEQLQARVAELELECDNARSAADGMEKASTRLTKELVKVHEAYSGTGPAPANAAGAEAADGGGAEQIVAEAKNFLAKTGENLQIQVYQKGETYEVRVLEDTGSDYRVPLEPQVFEGLDQQDPWDELFRRVGIHPGPPRQAVISEILGEREVALKPAGTPAVLKAFRYSPQRYFLSGTDLVTTEGVCLSVTESNLPPQLASQLMECQDNDEAFNTLVEALRMSADGKSLSLQ